MAVAEPVSDETIFLVLGPSPVRTLMKTAAASNLGSEDEARDAGNELFSPQGRTSQVVIAPYESILIHPRRWR
jgi:hypothetical protein